ncbi:MAG TPA: CocE/NonD family hydrolase [Candidatus Limnocylindrales bacterium]
MGAVSEPIHTVERRLDVRIPVSDGLELSANLWLPAAPSGDDRFPAILEMIPYRKDDWRANGDEARGRYLAARGFAFCRLDVRGTGSSPGIALDEYTAGETQDGYDAVEWLASQPWCNGNVGMWGISYGGFTSIQVAALRPPHLKAIVPMYATDDRYTDDVHYVGGCPTASELTQYAVSMVANNALPPRPSYRGDAWIDEWRERLDKTPIWLVEWLRQQRDGPYWRQGSLAPDYERIEAAILMFGGWMDSYVDPVFRMLEKCTAPRRAIVGNWTHEFPDDGYPGPNLDWHHEMVRFFDHWLKGIDNGVMDEPMLTWFEREWAPPEPFPKSWPGRWRAETAWPVPGRATSNLFFAPGIEPLRGALAVRRPSGRSVERLEHRPALGTRGPLSWGAGGQPNGLARDLRPDDALVPTWTSEPLSATWHVLGRPSVVVQWRSPVPVATAVVRLEDVDADGTPTQVTAGILNLTHRDGHDDPHGLPVGTAVEVTVPMRACGYRFAAGHRVRLSIASASWPVVWPSPEPATYDVGPGRLLLPVVRADGTADVPVFRTEPPGLDAVGGGTDEPAVWRVTEDVLAGTVTVTSFEGGTTVNGDGTKLYSAEGHDMTVSSATPSRARMVSEVVYRLEQDGHAIAAEATAEMTSTSSQFRLVGVLRVKLDGKPFHTRTWDETIGRDLC